MASWEDAHKVKSVSELNEISHRENLTPSRKVFLSAPLYSVICSVFKSSAPRDGNPHSKELNKQAFEFSNTTTYFQLLGLAQRKEKGECKIQRPRAGFYLLFLLLYLCANKTYLSCKQQKSADTNRSVSAQGSRPYHEPSVH